MKAVILLNGEFSGNKSELAPLFDNAFVFCADGGANIAFYLEVVPEKIIGDMDSISQEAYDYFSQAGVVFDRYPKDKDHSDFELLVEQIYDRFEEIFVIGGLGGRSDHSLFNLFMLERFPKLHFLNGDEEIFMVEEMREIKSCVRSTMSLLPLSEALIGVTLEGFKYPLSGADVWRGSSHTLSNVVIEDTAKISIESGKGIVVLNKEKFYE